MTGHTHYTPSLDVARNNYTSSRNMAYIGVETLEAFAEFDRLIGQVRSEAWLEGMAYGINYDAGDYEVAPEPIENPYQEEQS